MKHLKKFENSENKEANYMFFNNIKTIKKNIDNLLSLDESEIDELLKNGHDWAVDHISTSKDDSEEVSNFISNNIRN